MSDETDQSGLRGRLLDAGRSVFARMGYVGATVEDLLDEASVSRASFYRYFDSKEHLFSHLSRACFRDMKSIMEEFADPALMAGTNGIPRRIEEVLRHYQSFHERHRGVFRAWFERQAISDSDLRDDAVAAFAEFIDALARAIARAGEPSTVDVAVRASLLYHLVEPAYFAVTSRWSEVDPDQLAPTLAVMIHRAYFGGSPPGTLTRLRIG